MIRSLLQHLTGDPELEKLFCDALEVSEILRFEVALAEAEAETGLVSPADAAAIREAARGLTPDWADLAHGMAKDGVVVPALIRQLRAVVGKPHAGALHFGATSQDAIDTGLALRLASAIDIIETRLQALEAQLTQLAQRFGDLTMMAHTRMQRALPMTVADKITTWLEPLQRCRDALVCSKKQVLIVQLGGPVGTRAELRGRGDEVARLLATKLGLGIASPWHTGRDRIAGLASALSLISGAVGKLGADVALLSQNEVGSIALSGGGSSSAMPHKSNPVTAEVLVTLARFNAGLLGTLHQGLVHENERSGSAWTLEWMTLPQMVVATGASLRLALSLTHSMQFRSTTAR